MPKARSNKKRCRSTIVGLILFSSVIGSIAAQSQAPSLERAERFLRMSQDAEARGLAEPSEDG